MRTLAIGLVAIGWLGVAAGIGAESQADRSHWHTFSAATVGVAIDYPPDWSVEDDGADVSFRSNSGARVTLRRSGTDTPSEPAPGRRTPQPECTSGTNAFHVAARVCVDAKTHTRHATLTLATTDGRRWRAVLTSTNAPADVFDGMVATVRPVAERHER